MTNSIRIVTYENDRVVNIYEIEDTNKDTCKRSWVSRTIDRMEGWGQKLIPNWDELKHVIEVVRYEDDGSQTTIQIDW